MLGVSKVSGSRGWARRKQSVMGKAKAVDVGEVKADG